MSFEKRPTDLPYDGEQMTKTLARMQAALNYADCKWAVADRAWFTPEAHADDVENFGIEVRMEICGIAHNGREIDQLIDLMSVTAYRLRDYRSAQLDELRERARVISEQFSEIDIAEIWLEQSTTDCPATAPAGAN